MSDTSEEKSEARERLLAFADLLQRDREEEEEPEELQTWVLFDVATTAFGLPVSHVRELVRVGRMTRVPGAPEAVRGVTNLRGSILPVVDLAMLLGIGRIEIAGASRILVLDVRERLIGLLVDRVDQVAALAPSLFATAPPDRLPEAPGRALAIYPREADEALVLLDAERLVDEEPATQDRSEGTDD